MIFWKASTYTMTIVSFLGVFFFLFAFFYKKKNDYYYYYYEVIHDSIEVTRSWKTHTGFESPAQYLLCAVVSSSLQSTFGISIESRSIQPIFNSRPHKIKKTGICSRSFSSSRAGMSIDHEGQMNEFQRGSIQRFWRKGTTLNMHVTVVGDWYHVWEQESALTWRVLRRRRLRVAMMFQNPISHRKCQLGLYLGVFGHLWTVRLSRKNTVGGRRVDLQFLGFENENEKERQKGRPILTDSNLVVLEFASDASSIMTASNSLNNCILQEERNLDTKFMTRNLWHEYENIPTPPSTGFQPISCTLFRGFYSFPHVSSDLLGSLSLTPFPFSGNGWLRRSQAGTRYWGYSWRYRSKLRAGRQKKYTWP